MTGQTPDEPVPHSPCVDPSRTPGIEVSEHTDNDEEAKQHQDINGTVMKKRLDHWKVISGNSRDLRDICHSASVLARFHFSGRWYSWGHPNAAQHMFQRVGLTQSAIFGWVNRDIASLSLVKESAAISALHSDGPTVDLALSIGPFLDTGSLCDVYSISPPNTAPRFDNFPPLVLKVMNPSTFDDAAGGVAFATGEQATEAWKTETGLYAGKLASLQGSIVPLCFGAL